MAKIIVIDAASGSVIETDGEVPSFQADLAASDIMDHAAHLARDLVADYRAEERETWPQQVEEAQALLADPIAPAPYLRARAAGRGVEVAALAAVVLQKAEAYSTTVGAIYGAADALAAMDPIPADFRDAKWWP